MTTAVVHGLMYKIADLPAVGNSLCTGCAFYDDEEACQDSVGKECMSMDGLADGYVRVWVESKE